MGPVLRVLHDVVTRFRRFCSRILSCSPHMFPWAEQHVVQPRTNFQWNVDFIFPPRAEAFPKKHDGKYSLCFFGWVLAPRFFLLLTGQGLGIKLALRFLLHRWNFFFGLFEMVHLYFWRGTASKTRTPERMWFRRNKKTARQLDS